MSDEYYDEPPPPVPTFSDGASGGGRGANSRAAASRASASKSAVSAASRASAMMAATIQQLPKNSIITSTGIRTIQSNKPPVNAAAIQLAQKRASIIIQNAKPPEPIVIKPPTPDITPVIPVIPITTFIPKITTIIQVETPKKIQLPVIQPKPFVLQEYQSHVDAVQKKKEELLLSFTPRNKVQKITYPSIKNIKHKTVTEDRPINKDALEQLSKNLLSVINQSDKTGILDEFNNYETSLRISIEEPLHRTAIQNALTNKALYLTSDA